MRTQDLIGNQRRQLANQLSHLSEDEWDAETLCEGWTARHVVAHLVMPFRYSRVMFVVGLVRAKVNFNRFADQIARRDVSLPTDQLVGELRDNAAHPYRPPGGGYEGALTDLVVHSLDIMRPRHVPSNIDPLALGLVLDQLVGAKSAKFFGLNLDNLALRARDIDWSHGNGREVIGSAEDLVIALARRDTALDLTDDGASSLVGMAR